MARHPRGLVVGAFSLALLAATSCGGGDGNGKTASLDDFLLRYRTAICKSAVACGEDPDLATCLAARPFGSTEFATVLADVKAGKVRYDASQADACLQGAERRAQAPCTQSALDAADADLWLWLGVSRQSPVRTGHAQLPVPHGRRRLSLIPALPSRPRVV